jgi:iron complex outermembrane recepter protein
MKRTPIALAVAIASLSSMASAQVLEEVVVTAQKKAENLMSAPVAVSLISNDEMLDMAVFQADELNKMISGMEIRFEGDSNSGVGLRGVGTFSQQSAPSRVGTYMDDYYMASQASFAFASMYDMKSVQVLKGPQGTLYGQPSPTGALVMESADPNYDGVNGHIRGSYQDPKGYNLQGAVNLPIIDGTLAARIAFVTDDRETGTENPVRGLDEARNRKGIRAKLLWEPTENFTAKLGVHYMETDQSDTYRILETIDNDTANFNDLEAKDRIAIADARDEVLKREDTFVNLKLNWSTDFMDISWFSGALEAISSSEGDQDNTDEPLATIFVDSAFNDGLKEWQHELKFSGAVGDNWDWALGGYYATAASQTDVVVNQHIVGQGVFPFTLDIPIDTDIAAIFTHNTFVFGDLELVVGLRYNNFKQNAGNIQSGDFLFGSEMLLGGEITEPDFIIPNAFPCFDGQEAPCVLGESYDVDEWTGTIKASYFVADSLHVYGTLDRGYRPGAANFDTTGVFTPDFNAYDGETVHSFEIGAKGDVMDGRGRYTAAFFYSVYEDYQTQVNFEAYNLIEEEVETITNAPYVNVDEAVQAGIEADFRVLVNENWSMYMGATYVKVEFTDGTLPCTDPSQPPVGPNNRYNTCDADGETASPQPEWTAVFQTEYQWPQAIANSDAYVSALVNYRGEVEVPGDVPGRLASDDFTTVDAFTGLRNENWTAQIFVKNVLDEAGIYSKRPVGGNYNELTVTAPRTIGVTASYNF